MTTAATMKAASVVKAAKVSTPKKPARTPKPVVYSMAFDPRLFARAWLAVSLAASTDIARPVLCSIEVEQFAKGVRLVGTDSYMLVRAWVPSGDVEALAAEPGFKVKPLRTFTACDPAQRAAALLRYALKSPPKAVCLDFRDGLVITAGDESITLWPPDRDSGYPDWRALWPHESTPISSFGVNPSLILTRIAKITQLYGGLAVRMDFLGAHKPVKFSVPATKGRINGLFMPVRLEEDPQ